MIADSISACALGPGDQHLSSVLGKEGIRSVGSPCALGSGDHQQSSALGQGGIWIEGLPCALGPGDQKLSLLLGHKSTWTEGSLCILGAGDQQHSSMRIQAQNSKVGSPQSFRCGSSFPPSTEYSKTGLSLGIRLVVPGQYYVHITTGPMPPVSLQTMSPSSQQNT